MCIRDRDETTILQAASRTKGAAGPSMSNADDWRSILVSHHYGNTTVDLRKSIATMAKKLCTEKEDSDSIESLVGCRFHCQKILASDPSELVKYSEESLGKQ